MAGAMCDQTQQSLLSKLNDRSAACGVIGLGYVGLPLAVAIARSGYSTIGFDVDAFKARQLNEGRSYIGAVTDHDLRQFGARFEATESFTRLSECDVVIICVPTPLTLHREPDLSFVIDTAKELAKHIRCGQLIVLESTTYPGTTREVVKPVLEGSGLKSGVDFFLGFSPEREDPGNPAYKTTTIPKVVSGDGMEALTAVEIFYSSVVEKVVPASSMDTAEAVKITENVFRAVNIALVNELKMIFDRMDIDIWEVVEAAKTKPFGYMPFYPGPGLGGHCIPIDPFYLTWKSREFDITTRFIELAGEINIGMPRYVIGKLALALDRKLGKSIGSSRILVVGLAYKKNVSDVRESPSFKLLDILEERGATVSYHDPHVPVVPVTREHTRYEGMRSVPLHEKVLQHQDAVLIATDHDDIDYSLIARVSPIIVDTRNVFARKGIAADHIVKA